MSVSFKERQIMFTLAMTDEELLDYSKRQIKNNTEVIEKLTKELEGKRPLEEMCKERDALNEEYERLKEVIFKLQKLEIEISDVERMTDVLKDYQEKNESLAKRVESLTAFINEDKEKSDVDDKKVDDDGIEELVRKLKEKGFVVRESRPRVKRTFIYNQPDWFSWF